ncbi:uncharacterized protein LOC109613927 [Musca domestica]|uniref:Uncharacterized protein LOC109613927 n=1 Tax=Musca domestica TaxID=7370 RepID=A0A9J7DN27_MUSDO|nr:uncharacterized protein LOC109613927 [Musca domestica]
MKSQLIFTVAFVIQFPLSIVASQHFYFVDDHTSNNGIRKHLLYSVDLRPNYNYTESKERCAKLQMTNNPLLTTNFVRAIMDEELWIPWTPFVADFVTIYRNGLKLVKEQENRKKQLGCVCATELVGAYVSFHNGTSAQHYYVPDYCYPQAKLTKEKLLGLRIVACILIYSDNNR